MGWTYLPKPANVKKFFIDQLEGGSGNVSRKVLEMKIVGMKRLYAAVEHINKETQERSVFAVVILLNYLRNKNDPYNFGYKDLDETCGPYERNCPASILALLTPTTSENANEWRKECLLNAQKVKPTPGKYLLLEKEMTFTNGLRDANFLVTKSGKRGLMFRSLRHGFDAKITGINRLKYQISDAPPSKELVG